MSVVTCQTPDCGNNGVPIDVDLTWVDDDGLEHTAAGVQCGACGQPITDVTDPPAGFRARSGDHELSGKDDRG